MDIPITGIHRQGNMNKPDFDPSQSFQSIDLSAGSKPDFDPNQPFQAQALSPTTSGQQPPSELLRDAFKGALTQVVQSPVKIASAVSSPKNLYQTTGSYWPAAAATAGQMVLPGAGGAVGAGVGQITRNIAGIAYGEDRK